jgi:hypothetical protein
MVAEEADTVPGVTITCCGASAVAKAATNKALRKRIRMNAFFIKDHLFMIR